MEMTIRRDTPRVTTFDELFRKYDFDGMQRDISKLLTTPSVEIINDLTTGGTTKALSAEMGKRIANSNYRKTAVYRLGNDCDNNVEEWVFGGGSSNRNNYPEANKWYYVNTIHYTATMRKQIAYESQTGAVWTRDRLNSGVWLSWVPLHTISGSNANGYYLIFPDNTAICWGKKSKDLTFSPAGNVYYSGFDWISFPITFSSIPNVNVSVQFGNIGSILLGIIENYRFNSSVLSAESAPRPTTVHYSAFGEV